MITVCYHAMWKEHKPLAMGLILHLVSRGVDVGEDEMDKAYSAVELAALQQDLSMSGDDNSGSISNLCSMFKNKTLFLKNGKDDGN